MISYTLTPCPLGTLILAGTERGLHFVSFAQDESSALKNLFDEFPDGTNGTIVPDDSALCGWKGAIVCNLEGNQADLTIPVDVTATEFQLRVWEALREIPYGETATYSEIARQIGQPTAARAVARACATNPVAVVIPCHRVIREDGHLGGYRWGLDLKRRMLDNEIRGRNHCSAIQ